MNDQNQLQVLPTVVHTNVNFFENIFQVNIGESKIISPEDVAKIIQTKDWRDSEQKDFRSGTITKEIIKSRKKYFPNVVWHTHFSDTIEGEPNNFTGYALLDIDYDQNNESIEEVKRNLSELPFAVMVYRSASFGVHLIIRVDNIHSWDDYEKMYHQLSVKLYHEYDYVLCTGACSKTQRTYLSYDPDIIYNDNPESYQYEFSKSVEDFYLEDKNKVFRPKKSVTGKLKKANEDKDFVIEEELFAKFQELVEKGYYINHTIVDRKTQLPIIVTDEQFIYDFQKHTIRKYFDRKFIEKQKVHTVQNDMAKLDYKVYSFKMFFNKNKPITYAQGEKKRWNKLLAILCSYCFVQKMFDKPVTKTIIYNLASALNGLCQSSDGLPYPMSVTEIKSLALSAWDHYQNDSITPKFFTRKSVINRDFYKNNRLAEENPLECYKRIFIKLGHDTSLDKWTNITNSIKDYIEENDLKLNQKEICSLIAEQFNLGYNEVKYNLFKKKYSEGIMEGRTYNKIGTPLTIIIDSPSDDTLSKIQNLYNDLSGATQKVIAEKLGLSIITVKRHWKNVQKI